MPREDQHIRIGQVLETITLRYRIVIGAVTEAEVIDRHGMIRVTSWGNSVDEARQRVLGAAASDEGLRGRL